MIDVTCQCGKTFKVKDDLAGKRGKCPVCGTVILVPAPTPTFTSKRKSRGRWIAIGIPWVLFALTAFVAVGQTFEIRTWKRIAADHSNEIAIMDRRVDLVAEERDRNMANAAQAVREKLAAESGEREREREAERRMNEGIGREPKTPDEFAEYRRLAIKVASRFHNEDNPDGALHKEITSALILPGVGNWLFRTNEDSYHNVVVVMDGVADEKGMNEGIYVWAEHGPKAVANWYAGEYTHGEAFDIQSIDVKRFGTMDIVFRWKSVGSLYRMTINDFEHLAPEEIAE